MRISVILMLPLLFLLTGCGSDESVKKGERFEVLESLKEVAGIQGSSEYSDGFSCNIPKGTILEAMYPSGTSGFIECRPVVVNGKTDSEYILTTLVPEVVRRKEGFENFSITLSVEYIGTKIKKVGK